MAPFLTEQMCVTAWEISLRSIRQMYRLGVTNRLAGWVVVVNPTIYFSDPCAPSFNDALLFEGWINGSEEEAATYRPVALAKANLSWRTGLPSREVQQNPHLYEIDDVKWGGSVVKRGLVVAFSGVQAVFDEAIAAMEAELSIGMCRNEMTRPGGVMDSSSHYVRHPLLAGAQLDIVGSEVEADMASGRIPLL